MGYELFMKELTKGAFFLLEDWSRRWETLQKDTYSTTNVDIIREIFCYDRKYLLCLRTPCSGDFKADAEAAGKMLGLPLQWMDVTLDHLESVLRSAITRKNKELQCRK